MYAHALRSLFPLQGQCTSGCSHHCRVCIRSIAMLPSHRMPPGLGVLLIHAHAKLVLHSLLAFTSAYAIVPLLPTHHRQACPSQAACTNAFAHSACTTNWTIGCVWIALPTAYHAYTIPTRHLIQLRRLHHAHNALTTHSNYIVGPSQPYADNDAVMASHHPHRFRFCYVITRRAGRMMDVMTTVKLRTISIVQLRVGPPSARSMAHSWFSSLVSRRAAMTIAWRSKWKYLRPCIYLGCQMKHKLNAYFHSLHRR